MRGWNSAGPRARRSGQALVETALTVPVFFALVLAVFGFGQIYGTELTLVNASREGARIGALGHPVPDILATVQQYLSTAGLSASQVTVDVTGAQQASGQPITVQVIYPLSLALAIPGLPNPLTLSSQAVMRIE